LFIEYLDAYSSGITVVTAGVTTLTLTNNTAVDGGGMALYTDISTLTI
jgi:hypothetical protein